MDPTTQTVLLTIAAVLLVAFLARRRARLRREEETEHRELSCGDPFTTEFRLAWFWGPSR